MSDKVAIIAGAGPAGLTAALELLRNTPVRPLVFEKSGAIGGISRTVEYKGNRMDIGGHRFFSKSETIMQWWTAILPLQGAPARDDRMLGREVGLSSDANAPDPELEDRVMLVRNRLSRIYYLRKFFSYPITLSRQTLCNLGLQRVFRIALSYLRSRIRPITPVASLEDFFINRFGLELYRTFFRDYTEKVWGVPCREISPAWGAQRVKGLSVSKAVGNALRRLFVRDVGIAQKEVETSLIERYLYPKYGPGQMWEEVARSIANRGGEVRLRQEVIGVMQDADGRVRAVRIRDNADGKESLIEADYLISSMPVRDLVAAFAPQGVPSNVRDIARGLVYRGFVTVGLLLKRLKIRNETAVKTVNDLIPDTWIYIQEPDVRMGRLQIFNNWSPYLVSDINTVWLGVEYFCTEGDAIWQKTDTELAELAVEELARIQIIEKADVLDSTVARCPNAYPAYFGSYKAFDRIRDFADGIDNLFLIGRNGMHRYNNMDHSMLTAMEATRCIQNGTSDKERIWSVNEEEVYQEEKQDRTG